jgi:hypothetical protein
VNISGATLSSYTTPVTATTDSGSTFAVVVSNTAGSVTSTAATLTVNAAAVAPTITTQPVSQTVTAGQTATFAVVAGGTAPLGYQWQKNGANVAGAIGSSYTTPATTTSDNGSTYRVVVTNSAGSVTSGSATLTVTGGGGPNLTPPICGLNNDSTNHVPTGSAVTTVNGSASYSWHDFVLNVPDVGGTWVDNTYGPTPCISKILTNAASMGAGQTHNYAITSAMDFGDCFVLAQDANAGLSSQYIINAPTPDCAKPLGAWGTTAVDSAHMPSRTSHNEFVWDVLQGGKFWFAKADTIQSCTITGTNTLNCSTAHTFLEYAGSGCNFIDFTAMDPSGYIPVICQNTAGGSMEVFTYGTQTDTKNTPYITQCSGTPVGSNQPGCIHKVVTTPNHGVLIQFTGASNPENGNELWDPPFIALSMVESNSGGTGAGGQGGTDHVDAMKDLNGNEVALFEDFQNDPGPWGTCTHSYRTTITLLPLSGNPGCMYDSPVAFGMDISTRDYPARPWGLYSVQGSQGGISVAESCNNSGSYADPTSSNWNTFDNELLLTRVDAANNFTKIWRLGLTHERGKCGGNNYYSDPRAAISIDGKYVIYDTNARFGGTGTGPAVPTDIVVMGPIF